MKNKSSPYEGVSIDAPSVQRVDDIFWVSREAQTYTLRLFIPLLSETSLYPAITHDKGFLSPAPIPALCFEFVFAVQKTMELVSFEIFECVARNVAKLGYGAFEHFLMIDRIDPDIFVKVSRMLKNATTLTRHLRELFSPWKEVWRSGLLKGENLHGTVHLFAGFTNFFIGNYAISRGIPMLFRKWFSEAGQQKLIAVGGGVNLSYNCYAHVTSPIQFSSDVANQCNLLAFLRSTEYPLSFEDMRAMEWGNQHVLRLSDSNNRTFSIVELDSFEDLLRLIELQETGDQVELLTETPGVGGYWIAPVLNRDYVSAVHATLGKAKIPLPTYRFPDHKFIQKNNGLHCLVSFLDFSGKEHSLQGWGSNKRMAKQDASRQAFIILSELSLKSTKKTA